MCPLMLNAAPGLDDLPDSPDELSYAETGYNDEKADNEFQEVQRPKRTLDNLLLITEQLVPLVLRQLVPERETRVQRTFLP